MNLTEKILAALDASNDEAAPDLAAWVRRTWGTRLPVTVAREGNAVTVTAAGVAAWSERWPCFGPDSDRAVTFHYDASGNLCDVFPETWGADCDSSGVCALADDARDIADIIRAARTPRSTTTQRG